MFTITDWAEVFQAALDAEIIWQQQYDSNFPYTEDELELVAGQFIDNMDLLIAGSWCEQTGVR